MGLSQNVAVVRMSHSTGSSQSDLGPVMISEVYYENKIGGRTLCITLVSTLGEGQNKYIMVMHTYKSQRTHYESKWEKVIQSC